MSQAKYQKDIIIPLNFFSVKFTAQPEFKEYCHCVPKCERTEYEVTTSYAHHADHLTRLDFLSSTPPDNLAEIGRLQVQDRSD